MYQFKLPDPGEGLTEANIVSWKIAEGDEVKVNDIIVEIETSKSLVELPAPVKGRISKILVPEGAEDVAVGTPIVEIDDGSTGSLSERSDARSLSERSDTRSLSERSESKGDPGVQATSEVAPQADPAPLAEVASVSDAGAAVGGPNAAGGQGRPFLLPDPGEGLTEANIVSWKVAEGDKVKVNDIIVEIETSKSLVELPSPWTGTVVSILVPEGSEDVAVGTPIVMIDDGSTPAPASAAPSGRAASQGAPAAASVQADDEDDASGPNLVGYGAKAGQHARRPRKGSSAEQANAAMNAGYGGRDDAPSLDQTAGKPDALPGVPDLPQHQGQDKAVSEPSDTARSLSERSESKGKPLAKPPVRKYAKDKGVDLSQVLGTGPEGSITRADVDQFLASDTFFHETVADLSGELPPAQAQPVAAATSGPRPGRLTEQRVPIKGVRKVTAQAMVSSAFTKPHVTEWVEIDVTRTMELVETLKTRREFRDQKVSPLLVYAKAVCLAMARTPEINASWDEQAGEIVQHGQVNLGIAAATPRGLMVPNIKGADAMTLGELNVAINDLVKVAKDGKLQPADYSGGTFTITNVGVFGVDSGTPIINGNESAILAMGSITRKPWVVGTGADERIEPRWVTTLALSFDHRLIDGEQGSTFLRHVADILTDPAMALLF